MPLAVGGLSGAADARQHGDVRGGRQAAACAARVAVPVVWTVLYVLMGTASYLVLTSGRPNGLALLLYGAQLLFNFFWPLFFFQYAGVFVRVRLAGAFVAVDSGGDDSVFPHFAAGRLADGSVFAVGDLRRVSEPLNLSAELKSRSVVQTERLLLSRKKRASENM